MNTQNKKTILIIEDERILVETLVEKITAQNFEVITATNGEEGLKLALIEHPNLILLDLILPKMDGIALLGKLRADSWGKNAMVIILTNLSNPTNAMKVSNKINVGLGEEDEYIVKTNSSLDNLVARIKAKLK